MPTIGHDRRRPAAPRWCRAGCRRVPLVGGDQVARSVGCASRAAARRAGRRAGWRARRTTASRRRARRSESVSARRAGRGRRAKSWRAASRTEPGAGASARLAAAGRARSSAARSGLPVAVRGSAAQRGHPDRAGRQAAARARPRPPAGRPSRGRVVKAWSDVVDDHAADLVPSTLASCRSRWSRSSRSPNSLACRPRRPDDLARRRRRSRARSPVRSSSSVARRGARSAGALGVPEHHVGARVDELADAGLVDLRHRVEPERAARDRDRRRAPGCSAASSGGSHAIRAVASVWPYITTRSQPARRPRPRQARTRSGASRPPAWVT